MHDQSDGLDWRDNRVPVSRRFDDPYYSLDHGLNETRHVFLAGNGLPDRFRDGFQIAELGFGTGLNLLAVLKLWRDSKQTGVLWFTTFEMYPLAAPDMLRAQAEFPDVADIAQELRPFWEAGATRVDLPDLRFEMITGDARQTLPDWSSQADAWFLDGFSPAKNPELWQDDLLVQVGLHTTPDGTAATYSAAGSVRRALDTAGLSTERVPGFGRKRHMTIARKA
jgi:tRNA U34 5-methylaminomethyl-2-thiouridine-forming methyltransferase MnmC